MQDLYYEALMEASRRKPKGDVYKIMASRHFKVKEDDVTPDMRLKIKMFVYSSIYQVSL